MTKVYIKTWGCSLNKSDSEQMAGLLKQAQFEIIDNPEEAHVIILNSCTVKEPSENSLIKEIEKYKDSYKIIIVAGCVAQTDPEKFKNHSLVGTKQIHKIVEVVEEALNENIICNISTEENPDINLPKVRNNPIIEIIPICRGCMGYCSYCKTKSARGKLISYSIKEIKNKLRVALNQGAKEIWLTAQDCGCYGFDINTNLAELLNELTELSGDFKIRLGMMNPNNVIKIKDDLIKVYKSEKIFKFLHIPVQCGNDEILKEMKRQYSVEEFFNLVKEFKNHFPQITIATDIIVGFPGETESQYWDTLNLVRQISPDVLNISRFWPRSKTPAAKMKKQVKSEEIKRRSRVLTDIFQNISKLQNEKWIGWEGEILIDEFGPKDKSEKQMIGRNFAYKQVVVNNKHEIGEKTNVKISGSTTYCLIAM